MPSFRVVRPYMVMWLYLVAAGHLLGALIMTWLSDRSWLEGYSLHVLQAFGIPPEQLAVTALQVWWMSLFGATLQIFSLLLLLLIRCGDVYRADWVWLGLMLGLVGWAPQDMYFSYQKGIWVNEWVDLAALAILMPPLVVLWLMDRPGRGRGRS